MEPFPTRKFYHSFEHSIELEEGKISAPPKIQKLKNKALDRLRQHVDQNRKEHKDDKNETQGPGSTGVCAAEMKFSNSISQRFPRQVRITLLLVIMATACYQAISAQTLTIKLVDAKSGKPMRRQNVTVMWDNAYSSVVAVNDVGLGRVVVSPGTIKFSLYGGPRKGAEPYRVAYLDCNELASIFISVSEVVRNGIVPKNKCGNKMLAPHPGEIVFWALPRPFWDFQ